MAKKLLVWVSTNKYQYDYQKAVTILQILLATCVTLMGAGLAVLVGRFEVSSRLVLPFILQTLWFQKDES